MANQVKRPSRDFPETMKRLGITPPDTPFNRRAAVYAKHAVKVEKAAKRMRAVAAKRKAEKL